MQNYPEVILLTGFPSTFVGQKLLPKLLDTYPDTEIRCIVADSSWERALSLLSALSQTDRKRVKPLRSDLAKIDFGLSGIEFMRLASEVNLIHHCASVSTPGVDRFLAERENVIGTGEILEFAEVSTHLERLVYWSTTMVSGSRQGLVLEDELQKPSHFRNDVENTRFRAEKLVRNTIGKIPITILRPSTIVGDTKTGEIDLLDGLYLLIMFMLRAPVEITLPLPRKGNIFLNQVPICYVLDAALAITKDKRSIGRTFHIVDPNPLTVSQVCMAIAQNTEKTLTITELPTGLATTLLRIPGFKQLSDVFRTYLEQLSTPVSFHRGHTDELLQGTGIECPTVQSYLGVLIDYVRSDLDDSEDNKDDTDPLE